MRGDGAEGGFASRGRQCKARYIEDQEHLGLATGRRLEISRNLRAHDQVVDEEKRRVALDRVKDLAHRKDVGGDLDVDGDLAIAALFLDRRLLHRNETASR